MKGSALLLSPEDQTMTTRYLPAILLLAIAGLGVTLAQQPNQPRLRPEGAEPGDSRSGREGGIPRDRTKEQPDDKEGAAEGVPEIGSQPELRPGQARIAPPRGDWKLGVWGRNTDTGVVITRVDPNATAARCGLERGDKIVSVGGYQVGYVGDYLYPLGYELNRQANRRGEVLLLVQNVRNSELQNIDVPLDRDGSIRPLPRDRVVPE
jgi:hypothetical protein